MVELKRIGSFANIFKENNKYQTLKKNYLKDTSNSSLEREVKEAFKCTIACDYMELLKKSCFMRDKIVFPEHVKTQLKKSKVRNAFQTIMCVAGYTNTQNKNYCDCGRVYTTKLKHNRNHKFISYFKHIHKDSRKELFSFKGIFDVETMNKYRAMLLIYRLVFYTFYSKSLPKYISIEMFDTCNTKSAKFCDYYKFNKEMNNYKRKRFVRKAALEFNDEIAWEIFCYEINHYNLNG